MIPVENVPKLQALWERADAAFLADDGYIVAMAEAAGKIYERRKAQRERDEARADERAKRPEARRAQAREGQAERAVVPDAAGLSAATLRYRAKMAAMTPDEQKAFHKAKNAAHAAKRAETAKVETAKVETTPKPKRVPMTPEEERERRNAKARAKRAAMTPEERQAHDRETNARARAARSPEREAELREYQRQWAAEKKRRQREAGGDVGGAAYFCPCRPAA